MNGPHQRLMIFSDLDGCLLNKHDYDWSDAAGMLQRLRELQIPVILNSSKTVAEMTPLAHEFGLSGETFISENGSVIRWGDHVNGIESQPLPHAGGTLMNIEVIGASREHLLSVLHDLKPIYRFRSFADLGVIGVIEQTQLSPDKAELALSRQGTEPLLWDDTHSQRLSFEKTLNDQHLTLTQGGRFWHVAGHTSKGRAMQVVAKRLSLPDSSTIIAAIGDSPIDQSMLDLADVPIGIPTSQGLGVDVDPQRGIVASRLGAAGWAEAVGKLLAMGERLD